MYRGHREDGWREEEHSHVVEQWPFLPPSPESTLGSLRLSPKKKKVIKGEYTYFYSEEIRSVSASYEILT